MKLIVVGGNGTIGSKVVEHFSGKHDIVIAGRGAGDIRVDIADTASIKKMYADVDDVDGVICVAGEAKWDYFDELTEEDFYIGLRSKLMGQVNLVRIGMQHLNDGGSFTLTTGILAEDPVAMTASAAMVNGGIHSFVKAVALELNRGLRINVVAAGMVDAAEEKYRDYFPGHNAVPMGRVVNGYVRSVEGRGNGEIIRVYE